MSKVNRRDFLGYVGAGGAGAGAGFLYAESTKKTVELLVPQVIPPEEFSPGIATWYNTVCKQCAAGCGISVRTREGRAKKIEGNPVHPVNQGRLCASGQAGLNTLYNPDRIRTPLKRSDSGTFEEISWDEALLILSGALSSLKLADRGDRVYFLAGGVRGHLDGLFADFMQGLGSSNYAQYDFTFPINEYAASKICFGQDSLPYYDIRNSDFLLSFGADYLGTWNSPVHHGLAYGHMRQGRAGRRGTCVQVEPRMSLSGASADEWVAAKPGTEGLLALGIAHSIIEQGAYSGSDKADWAAALAEYSPQAVATITDVSAERIEHIAGAFAASPSSLAIAGGAVGAGTNGLDSLVAINALNLLANNLNKPGGVIFNTEAAFADGSSKRHANFARMLELRESLHGGEIEILLLHNTNPVFNLPNAAEFAAALEAVPTVVSLSSFMDETTAMADLILPTDTYLEAWGDDIPEPGVGFPVATISQPVVSRVFDTRSVGDIVLALARQIGAEMPSLLPWATTEEYIKDTWARSYAESRAEGDAEGFEAFWIEALKAGVWGRRTGTAPGGSPDTAATIGRLGVAEAGFSGDAQAQPFVLHPYLTTTFHDGRGANLPWLQELPDPLTSVVYSSWVELNPATAAELDISEGDVLEVQSPEGSLEAPALLFEAIRPDVVAMPIGQGHTGYGRYAKDRGANPLSIVAPQVDERSGGLAWAATRVAISKTGKRINLIKTAGTSRTLGRNILSGSGEDHT